MTIQEYLDKVNILHKTGNAREHSYRGDLQNLIMAILPDILVTNEPARVECGAPDYVLTHKDVPVGYIEAKDIGVDLGSKTLKEQFDRYKSGLSNLIFTDYMDFHFYKDGELTTTIAIAKLENGAIIPLPQNFEQFNHLIQNFAETVSQTIKSPTKLAEMMAGKAKLMADIIEKSLNNDDKLEQKSNLKSQMLSFKSMLIHDIDNKGFADIYAQTIAYGMFAARYHDPTLEDFSRQEAAELIPKSNPFLRKLFHDIAGYDLDSRLAWIVDELVNIFLASDVAEIMKNFGKSTKQEDPVVHFYETFLGEYNPALKKARGVWYTPQPVVSFIVRAVDDILKSEFGLSQGLADTSKIKIKKKAFTKATADQRSKLKEVEVTEEVHRVQILDPATGTGTFLAEVVKHIYKKFEGQQGIWSKYVKDDLIPRLNGFEILMASYAMAHLKMDMLLTETGYSADDDKRFRIFLTNSLEEAHPDTGTLFSSWLSEEADQANAVKRDTPVMCVIGNPPYSVSSSNKSKWIEGLIADYKKDLNEKNIQPLSDDYIKFTRYGQHFIDKNGEGILAYISNSSFIDGIIHKQMRKSLLESFDKIYILDLHGNTRKKETSPDGSVDQNVFDIMAGVSINLFVKTGKSKSNELGKVFHYDLYGKREHKYPFLLNTNFSKVNWQELKVKAPYFFFIPKDLELLDKYEQGINLKSLFPINSMGIATGKDDELVNMDSGILEEKYGIKAIPFSYRPYDIRYTIFDNAILQRARYKLMKNYLLPNIGLNVVRQSKSKGVETLVNTTICNRDLITNHTYNFPLYIYNENAQQQSLLEQNRIPNLNQEILSKIASGMGLEYNTEENNSEKSFSPIDILDYIYSVLHSSSYRAKYKELLKIDIPKIPYPVNNIKFWQLVRFGKEIREIQLLESHIVEKYITKYPKDGDNVVLKPDYRLYEYNEVKEGEPHPDYLGYVYINDTQYFEGVPESVWNFYIGGYQPAQKWLKDRKDRELSFEDILHYQKIIVALSETDRIMKEIDKIDIE